ncbi:hypothetical protein [Nonomuraea angiospora]|uniref:hypothetical protein n=1 Tax=Nonomuraea angiospora TaxID=46172 RepID=UPI0029BF8B73|nr:hypothetical protein [Nonomuraea angiospora]MDX3110320.1 hypothetical protein [Nonomuraea angiospora]
MTDAKPPAHLRPARVEKVAGSSGTGRDTAGGTETGTAGTQVEAAEVGTAGSKPEGAGAGAGGSKPEGAGAGPGGAEAAASGAGAHARHDPAAELGFSGDPGQRGDDTGDTMLHAQRVWDSSLATNRLDELGVKLERQRTETKDVTVSVSLLVDGWPEDVRKSVGSIVEHTNARVLALDLGDVDGAGEVLDELADRHPDRIAVWHVAEEPHWRGGTATWGECRAKLLRLDESDVHVLMDTNVELSGDALTPLVAAIAEGAVAAGWRGVDFPDGEPEPGRVAELGRVVEPEPGTAGPRRVRALTGELMAVRRGPALGALPEDAGYGRNADLALSLALQGRPPQEGSLQQGRRELVVPEAPLPAVRLGSHDVDLDYDARESRRNFDRVLRILGTS